MSARRTAVAGRGYRLTRNFAVICLIVLAVAGAAMAKLNLDEANKRLLAMAETHNRDLTKVLASALWPLYGRFVDGAAALGADGVRAAPETAALSADARAMMRGSRLIKVKIYDLSGFTVFSTDPAQIGGDYSRNPRYLTALETGTSSELEYRARFETLEGVRDNRWVLSSYIPIFAGGDAPVGVFEIYSDVTELRAVTHESLIYHGVIAGAAFLGVFVLLLIGVWRADQTIAREQAHNLVLASAAARAEAASKAKSEFLANMSHELRTPLNAIIGFADLIRSETMGPIGTAAYRSYAGDIRDAGRHLLAIISDVLDLARVESGRMEVANAPFDIRETIGSVLKMMRAQAGTKRQTLALDCAPRTLMVEGDEHKTRQVLINLLSNAMKFTPDGGVIRVTAASTINRTIVISVTDTGIGMREEDIPLALSPFGRLESTLSRSHEGTGLGLTLSRKLTETMGGRLEIASTPDRGTTVTVVLPERRAAPYAANAA